MELSGRERGLKSLSVWYKVQVYQILSDGQNDIGLIPAVALAHSVARLKRDRHKTDRQTDGRTDRRRKSKPILRSTQADAIMKQITMRFKLSTSAFTKECANTDAPSVNSKCLQKNHIF